ncbi:MAG: two-component system response regulator, partial [Pseudomonadota bacterium]
MTSELSIIVVEADRDRAMQIVDSLRDAGYERIQVIAEASSLRRQIAAFSPDVVLIDMADPSRDMLEEMALASGPLERPVAMFVDRSDDRLTSAEIEAGVSADVVDGMR